jgi:hypothetical protein
MPNAGGGSRWPPRAHGTPDWGGAAGDANRKRLAPQNADSVAAVATQNVAVGGEFGIATLRTHRIRHHERFPAHRVDVKHAVL